jgi:hypothetical protein
VIKSCAAVLRTSQKNLAQPRRRQVKVANEFQQPSPLNKKEKHAMSSWKEERRKIENYKWKGKTLSEQEGKIISRY